MVEERKATKARVSSEFRLFAGYLNQNRLICGLAAFAAIFAYGFSLTHYTLSIDEEIALVRGSEYNWSSQGRFGLDLIKMLLQMWNTNSVTSSFLAVFLLALSGLVLAFGLSSISNKEKSGGKIDAAGCIMVLVFLTFPVHTENIGFSMMSFELGVGWLAMSAAAVFISKWAILHTHRSYFWTGLLLATFATSIYQGFLPAVAMALVIHLLMYLLGSGQLLAPLSNRWYFGRLLLLAGTVAGAFALYKSLDWFVHFYIPSSGYVENFMAWGKESPSVILNRLLDYFKDFFGGEIVHGSAILLPSVIAAVLLFLIFLYRTIFDKRNIRSGWITITLAGYILIPFAMYLLLGMPVPVRGSFAWALLVSSVWVIFYDLINRQMLKKALLALVMFTVFLQANAASRIFYSDYNRYQDDIQLANHIAYRIMDLNLGESPPYPVVFVGSHTQKERKGLFKQEVIGHSFFEWDGGNPMRMNAFMKALGYDYQTPAEEQKSQAAAAAAAMPIWPDRESIALVGGLVIVNLSESGVTQTLEITKAEQQLVKEASYQVPLNPVLNDIQPVAGTNQGEDLVLKAGGNDPSVIFSFQPGEVNNSYDTVELTFNADQTGRMQIFIQPLNEGFSEKLSGYIDIQAGSNTIYCNIPKTITELTGIRLDPPDQLELTLKSLRLIKRAE